MIGNWYSEDILGQHRSLAKNTFLVVGSSLFCIAKQITIGLLMYNTTNWFSLLHSYPLSYRELLQVLRVLLCKYLSIEHV
jgi:hypothetical protein